jgi:ABC-type bacteriocin/lantibiotic exporter with double-glycine peptidase domain
LKGGQLHLEKNASKKKASYYLRIFHKNKLLLFFTMLFSIIASGTGVTIAYLLKKIIDVTVEGDIDKFKITLIYNIVFMSIFGLFYYTYSLLSKKLLKNVIRNMRKSVFTGIFRRNYQDFYEVNTADYISALTNDIKMVEDNYLHPLLDIIQHMMSFIYTLVYLLIISPMITLILFVGMVLMLLIPGAIGKMLQGKQEEVSNQNSIFTGKIKDLFSGFEVIKSFHLFGRMKEHFDNENDVMAVKKYKADKLFVLNETASQMLALFSQVFTMFTAAYLVIQGQITMGTLIAIIQLSGNFVVPLMYIMNNMPKIQSVAPIVKRMEQFDEYKDASFVGKQEPKFVESIKISNLSFSYHEEQSVLENITLEIEKGKKYAIIGESGCGKSTLAKLLMGYYSNYTGKISYDQTNLMDCELAKISELASIIHQNVYMFDRTIRENICLFHDYSSEAISNAVNSSGVDKFLSVMQEQMETMVGENGSNLSGGQRQRIAIARALVKGTPLLILDEGTSAIDLQTSNDIEQNLLNKKELTLITITHKLNEELLEVYDQIIYMEKGRIVERGNYKELFSAKNGFYNFCVA